MLEQDGPAGARLAGKVVLLTEGRPELLRPLLAALAAEGAELLLLSRGGGAEGVRQVVVDAGMEAEPDALAAAVLAPFGRIDIVVTLPQPAALCSFAELEPEAWETGFGQDLGLVFLGSRAAVPQMLKQGAGCLVHLVPAECVAGREGAAIPAAIGFATLALSKSIALDFAGMGVRSNCVVLDAEDAARGVAALAVLLASEAAAGINAQVLIAGDNEVHLLDQPRPVRILHRDGGWDAGSLGAVLPGRWADAFFPLEGTRIGQVGEIGA